VGPASLPRVQRKGAVTIRKIACLRAQDRGRSNHIHQRTLLARNSPSFLFSQMMRQLFNPLSDDVLGGRCGCRSQLNHGCPAWRVRLRCWSDARKQAIEFELKLHSQKGRSSSFPRNVVATSASTAILRLKSTWADFPSLAQLRLCYASTIVSGCL
jgi:hypothetical protein